MIVTAGDRSIACTYEACGRCVRADCLHDCHRAAVVDEDVAWDAADDERSLLDAESTFEAGRND